MLKILNLKNKYSIDKRPRNHTNSQGLSGEDFILGDIRNIWETHSLATYKVYKEPGRLLDEKKASISAEKAIDIAKTICNIKVQITGADQIIGKTIITNEK